MCSKESPLEADRVLDNIVEALKGRFFPLAGIHFNQHYSRVERHVWRKLPSDRPDEQKGDYMSKATQHEKMLSITFLLLFGPLSN